MPEAASPTPTSSLPDSLPATGTAWALPDTVGEATQLLRDAGPTARPVAGCTAVPPFALAQDPEIRLAVDLLSVGELSDLSGDGSRISIGSTLTIERLAGDEEIARRLPLLAFACGGIGDEVLRGMATIGGNLLAAPPSAFELPAVIAALGGRLELASADGSRTIGASALADPDALPAAGEVLVSVTVPEAESGRWIYRRLATNMRFYGVASLAISVPDASPPAAFASAGSSRPQRLGAVEQALASSDSFDPREIGEEAAASLECVGDALASADYRRRALAAVIADELAGLAGSSASR